MRAAALAVAVLAGTSACGGGNAPKPGGPPAVTVVPGPASRWASITVTAGDRSADVPPTMWRNLTPLLASRAFTEPDAPATYGLDRPIALLRWRAPDGATAEVTVGGPDFNHHLAYAAKPGERPVYLLAADALGPVLALVGVTLPEPT